ncbi:NADH-cytochrome b5 reductase 2-A [Trichinella pseudospiralis]
MVRPDSRRSKIFSTSRCRGKRGRLAEQPVITDVICAPSLKCVAAAASFIEGYESDVKNNRHSQKQFRSLAIERGYCIDQLYKSALNLQRGCSGQRSLAYDDYLRLHTTLDAIRKVCLRSATKRVVLFVDRSLEKQLKLMITDPSFKFGSFIIGSIKDTL